MDSTFQWFVEDFFTRLAWWPVRFALTFLPDRDSGAA
jgi:hypothetical protein